jgi:hypothetical protein
MTRNRRQCDGYSSISSMGWNVDDVKTFSLLDTFKIAFASALPLHVVDLVLQAIDLLLAKTRINRWSISQQKSRVRWDLL